MCTYLVHTLTLSLSLSLSFYIYTYMCTLFCLPVCAWLWPASPFGVLARLPCYRVSSIVGLCRRPLSGSCVKGILQKPLALLQPFVTEGSPGRVAAMFWSHSSTSPRTTLYDTPDTTIKSHKALHRGPLAPTDLLLYK